MKNKMLLIVTCIIIVSVLSILIFLYFHPTHYKYNDLLADYPQRYRLHCLVGCVACVENETNTKDKNF